MTTGIRITVQALHDAIASAPPDLQTANALKRSWFLAVGILKAFFGEEWLHRYVVPDSAQPNFLRVDICSEKRHEETTIRIIDLAEVIFNLQHVHGFDDCIARMRRGDIEGTHAELDLGRMLFLHHAPFRYVVPQGVKGCDYDVEVLYPNGVTACADAKCKIVGTTFGANKINNALKKAKTQLPDDRPGIVFIKVPEDWMEVAGFEDIAVNTAHAFLRGTRRIVSVKFYVSPIALLNGWMKLQHAYKEISNPYTDFGDMQNWTLFPKIEVPPEWNGMPPHWQRVLFFPDGKPRD
jgi:hypothetical protein